MDMELSQWTQLFQRTMKYDIFAVDITFPAFQITEIVLTNVRNNTFDLDICNIDNISYYINYLT